MGLEEPDCIQKIWRPRKSALATGFRPGLQGPQKRWFSPRGGMVLRIPPARRRRGVRDKKGSYYNRIPARRFRLRSLSYGGQGRETPE